MQVSKDIRVQAHYLFPSNIYASNEHCVIQTLLGSCVAICLHDPVLKIGGMNHYMLPLWNGHGLETPKYGNIAIEMILEKMIRLGSKKQNIQAKVFGGANIHDQKILTIGERNISIAQSTLENHKIPVIASSVGGEMGRNIKFDTCDGKVIMKYILNNHRKTKQNI